MEANKIKKVLYKEKPIASLTGRTGDSYDYETQCSLGTVQFSIPSKEMKTEDGKDIFRVDEQAQLLIRWLVQEK